jgi:DNA-binding NarL/FixJ family response regulator
MRTIRVAVVSDDRLFADGLRRLLASDRSLVVALLNEQFPTLDALRSTTPDALLVEARTVSAFDLCVRMKESHPSVKTIFVGVNDDDSAIRALAAGACGILEKSAASDQLSKAIHTVMRNEIWAPRRIVVAAWMRDARQRTMPEGHRVASFDPRLTHREMEVLRHAAAGLGNRELARQLAISESTVKVHLTRIFQKLGLRGRAKLAAAYHGIVAPTDHQSPARRSA